MKFPDFSRANCTGSDPEAFFAEGGYYSDLITAKRVCARCEILDSCAQWAIRHESDGFWAGMTAGQRKEIRRQQGIVLMSPHNPLDAQLAS